MTFTDCISRKEGKRGLASIEDSMVASIQRLEDYIEWCLGKLITVTRNTDNISIKKMKKKKTEKTERKTTL